MAFTFAIPSAEENTLITVEPGSSAILVGANGGGKTRLAVHIESTQGDNAHRISAHRALALNPAVPKISERVALRGLRTGYADATSGIHNRPGSRWHGQMAVAMLNDFDFLIQVLFADQANTSLETHRKARSGDFSEVALTKFEQLISIWNNLLPHRQLHISGDDIEVSSPTSDARYSATEMSDGERAIFYLIGQVLAASEDSLLILDEPELHVHRSIMSKLWDELEAARPDCAFVFITHDLEFAANRIANKYVIRDYKPTPVWTVDAVPENSGFDESIATLILGSRRPILFVEGDDTSLDMAVYRCCFPDWTVISRGSCEEVIHSVVTMRRNESLTRVTCSGVVDADDYAEDDIQYMRDLGVEALKVSELENIFLLPDVSRVIASGEGYDDTELDRRLQGLKAEIFATLGSTAAINVVVARYCKRRIDRQLKKIDLSAARSVEEISAEYIRRTTELDIDELARGITSRMNEAIQNDDLTQLLAYYDNKGMMAFAARWLKEKRLVDFESWLTRSLRNNKAPELLDVIRSNLPAITAR